jgi:DMSO/TMAO reductase YedYZ molybdopterin-dependent catalytic subunit
MAMLSRGFRRRGDDAPAGLPPGQHPVGGFPVLSAGPTPRVRLYGWTLEVTGAVDRERRLTWEELRALPPETFTCDLHCVTAWSKVGMRWRGVRVDTVLEGVGVRGAFLLAECDGGYDRARAWPT